MHQSAYRLSPDDYLSDSGSSSVWKVSYYHRHHHIVIVSFNLTLAGSIGYASGWWPLVRLSASSIDSR